MRLFFQKTDGRHLASYEARKFLFIILLVMAFLPVQPAQTNESQTSLVQEKLNGLKQISHAVDTSEIPDINLTAKERQWLKDHPVITLGGGIFPPLDFVNEDGRTVDVGPSYTDLVGEKLGITFKYVSGNWDEIQQMAREKKIDGIRLFVKNRKREEYLNFSKPYTTYTTAIFILEGSKTFKTLSELSGKKVGVMRQARTHMYLKEKNPDTYPAAIR